MGGGGMGPGISPGGIIPGMGITNPGRGGKPPISFQNGENIASPGNHQGTLVRHHVLCFMFQPVHVIEFDGLFVLASRVVCLAH